jgi:hypothetical protein
VPGQKAKIESTTAAIDMILGIFILVPKKSGSVLELLAHPYPIAGQFTRRTTGYLPSQVRQGEQV